MLLLTPGDIPLNSHMANNSLSDQLKEQTLVQHQELEKQVVAVIKSINTRDDYKRLLTLFYTYFGGVELLVDKSLDTESMPDYKERRKTASLAHDLQHLGSALPPLVDGTALPSIANHLQALGAMYVMEGSTLGGMHISKMISKRLPGENADAFTFFNGYLDNTQQMWQKFKTTIDSGIVKPDEMDIVITAANETFKKFAEWVTKSEKKEI